MQIDFYQSITSKSDQALVFVGGSEDTKDTFKGIVKLIRSKLTRFNICTFSFRSPVENKHSLTQQSKDLEEVFDYLLDKKKIKFISIFCTSMGAYSTCYLLISKKYSKTIQEVIFFDPADYYLAEEKHHRKDTWSGFEEYQPHRRVVSDLLKDVNTEVKANVIHLIIRNHGSEGYISEKYSQRGQNNSSFFPRLNTDMVKSFYNKLPKKNQGIYVEKPGIPHGFCRDGNVKQNQKRVADLIVKLLT